MSRDGYLPPDVLYSDIPGDRPEDWQLFTDESEVCEVCGRTDCVCVEYNPLGEDEIR